MVNAGRRLGTASFLCGLSCAAGCTSQASAPVQGTVMLNSKPLNDASVVFSPVRATNPWPFIGTTDSAGRFTLMSPDKKVSGATPGTYMIMITTVKFDPNAPDGPPLRKETVPVAFTNGSQRFEVPPGGTQEANFDIKNSSEK